MAYNRPEEQGGAMLLAAWLRRKQTIAEHSCYAWRSSLRSASEFARTVRTGGRIVCPSPPAAETF